MKEIFEALYTWFGTNPLFSNDLKRHLMGLDITCSDFTGPPWITNIALLMIVITILMYAIQYHIFDTDAFCSGWWWWINATFTFVVNFVLAFIITFYFFWLEEIYCPQLNIPIADLIGFSVSNGILSFVLFVIISSTPLPRMFSKNCDGTTFWKPF